MIRVLVLAAGLAALLVSPAEAGPVITALTAAFTAAGVGATAAAALATGIVRAGVSLLLSAISTALRGKPRAPGIATETTQTGGQNPQTFVLGRYATAGTHVCPPMSHGEAGKTPNAYLTYVIDLGDLPITSVDKVWIGEKETAFDGALHADYGTEATGDYAGRAWLKVYDGTQTVADAMLLAKYGSYPERPWSADMIGTGVPYAILTFRYDREVFNGLPQVRFEVTGIPLYDPRKDSTEGGTGAHRWADTSTWEPTVNPMVQAYNLLRGIALPDGSVYGARVASGGLPTDVWFAAMNACDADAEIEGGTEPAYRAGFEVSVDDEPFDVLDELMKAASAEYVEAGGTWYVRVGPVGLPVYFFSDDDILRTSDQDLDPFPGLEQTHNAIHATYPDPAQLWEAKDAPPRYDSALEAEDDGRRLTADVALPAVPYADQVQRLMKAWIEDARRFRQHGLTLPPEALAINPLEAVSWTSARNGYTDKVFEVGTVRVDPRTLNVAVSLRERDPGDYDWVAADLLPTSTPSTLIVEPVATTVPGWNVSPVTITDATGTDRRPAIQLSWTAPLDGVRGIKWEVRRTGTSEVILSGSSDNFDLGLVVLSENLLPATDYEARGRLVTDLPTTWTAWTAVTTPNVGLTTDDLAPDVIALIDAAAESAEADKLAAQAAASAASTAQTNAETAQGLAESARDAAQTAATSASDYSGTAQTAASNAQAAQSLAETAKTDAQAAATSASSSSTTAASHASAAGNSASAAATSETNAGASATDAASSASAAQTARLAAETAQAAASTSETNAATSESNAAGSASSAATSASTATSAASDAGNSASAAQTSANTASSQATAAGDSASQAATSASLAADSATAAGNSASAASSSATSASSSATSASSSASVAASAATTAEAARDDANTYAQAALGHSQSASAYADDASASATAAEASNVSAATSASNASASETSAATSATNAASSASSAASSESVVASSANTLYSTVAAIGVDVLGLPVEAWSDDYTDLTNYISASDIKTGDLYFGECYQFPGTTNLTVGPSRKFAWDASRVYAVTVRFRTIQNNTGVSNNHIGSTLWEGDTRDTTASNRQADIGDYIVGDGVVTKTVWFSERSDLGSLPIEETGFSVVNPASAGEVNAANNYVSFHFRQNASDLGTVLQKVDAFEVRDVTALVDAMLSEDAAAAAATAAALSESTAGTYADDAGVSAGAAASSATTAIAARNAAQSAEANAAASASAAGTYASDAATSEQNAASSAATATSLEQLVANSYDRIALIDTSVSNAGFEAGANGVKGAPTGWKTGAQNPTNFLANTGYVNTVNASSPFASLLAYGNAATTSGPWWYISKLFLVTPGVGIGVDFWYRLTQTGDVGSVTGSDAKFVGEDDVLFEVVWYNADGDQIGVSTANSACSSYWAANGTKPPAATWLNRITAFQTAPANAAFGEARLVAVDGSDTIVSNRSDYQTWASGNAAVLLDDVVFKSNAGDLLEIDFGALNTAVSAAAAVTQAAAAASSATDAGNHATAALISATNASTSASEASTSAGQASASAEDAEGWSSSAQAWSEVAAKVTAGGFALHPTISEWTTNTNPVGFLISTAQGSVVKNTDADNKYGTCALLTTPASPSTSWSPQIYLSTADTDYTTAPKAVDVDLIEVTLEVSLESGAWGGAGIYAMWHNDAGGYNTSEWFMLAPELSSVVGLVQRVTFLIERPAGSYGNGYKDILVRFTASSNKNGQTPTANTIKVHYFDWTPVTQNAVSRLVQKAFVTHDGHSGASIMLGAYAGGAAGEIAAVAYEDPTGTALSEITLAATTIKLKTATFQSFGYSQDSSGWLVSDQRVEFNSDVIVLNGEIIATGNILDDAVTPGVTRRNDNVKAIPNASFTKVAKAEFDVQKDRFVRLGALFYVESLLPQDGVFVRWELRGDYGSGEYVITSGSVPIQGLDLEFLVEGTDLYSIDQANVIYSLYLAGPDTGISAVLNKLDVLLQVEQTLK